MKFHRPEDLFRAEKERAQTVRNSQHARLLAEAKAAFDKLMAEGQAARKSGRPRKHPLPPLKTSSARPVARPVAPAPAVVTPKPAPVSAPAARVAKPASKTVSASKGVAKSAPRKARAAKKSSAAKARSKRSSKR